MMKLTVLLLVYVVHTGTGQRWNKEEKDLWTLSTSALPIDVNEPKLMPMLGNGYIGLNVFQPSVRAQCLYSGKGGQTHRSRIESYSNLRMDTKGNSTYSLNMKLGVFEELAVTADYTVKHTLLVHREIPGLIINTFHARSKAPSNSIHVVPIRYTDVVDDTTEDVQYTSEPYTIQLGENKLGVPAVSYVCGRTEVVEDSKRPTVEGKVCVGWSPVSDIVFTSATPIITKTFITIVTTSVEDLLVEISKTVDLSVDLLLESHNAAWRRVWRHGSLLINGNDDLAQTVIASMFYLYSSLPLQLKEVGHEGHEGHTQAGNGVPTFCGLSPGGLSYGGLTVDDYKGHNFWDTEIWMFPSILLFQSDQAKNLLNYRLNRMEAARRHAHYGGWQGAQFPWESALTGAEVCPDIATILRENQVHISGDISFAARQYLAVTGDLSWFYQKQGSDSGCSVVTEIAKYWASRISQEANFTSINHVMGPDEDHEDVDNNVYTNVIASYSVYFANFLSCAAECEPIPADFLNKVKHLKLEYDADMDFHPQYTGYKPGTQIKQADTVLVGFPLMYNMSQSTRANDLAQYGDVVRSSGPAMTWGMHAIGHIETENYKEAEHFFNKSYQPYIREPFLMWTEQQLPNMGAVNFNTGMGGFLQGVLFGYLGIRTRLDRMDFNLKMPPQSSGFEVVGLDYHGGQFNLIMTDQYIRIAFSEIKRSLVLRQGIDEYLIEVPTELQLRQGQFSILPYHVDYLTDCDLPLDLIGL